MVWIDRFIWFIYLFALTLISSSNAFALLMLFFIAMNYVRYQLI